MKMAQVTFLLFGELYLRIGNMLSVPWIILFVGQFFTIPLGRIRPNSFEFPRSQR